MKSWPPGLRAASNRYDTLFVETLGDNSLNFNTLSEALFASKSYNPITSVGLFNDELSNKLLLVLEASCDTSHNLLNNFFSKVVSGEVEEKFEDSFIRNFLS